MGAACDGVSPSQKARHAEVRLPVVPVVPDFAAHDLDFDPIPDHPTVINFKTKYKYRREQMSASRDAISD